jgi:predicted unusual protein kinase regulating ubiquinone biosynthesis (AarF/ABC1/UbiB family)
MKMDDTTKGKVCILDFGLMAEIPTNERESMVSAIIHLGNKNFDALTDDFINLGFLPEDVDRAVVTPVT